tara:strand:+ start:317 stop:892 length:576 start_codon:yes stop_codon:yes gene_type:complete
MTTIYRCCHGKTIRPGKSWTDEQGVKHPASWHTYSAERKAQLGITEIVQEPPPDSRLYSWSYNNDGTVNSTAKAMDDVNVVDDNGDPVLDENGDQLVELGVKSTLKNEVKSQQGSLLAQTDWAVVRKYEKSTAIPSNISTWRDAIRSKATAMETAINGAADTAAVEALFLSWDVDGNKAGILYDWPELVDN